jgi:L-asparaginase II
MGPRPKAEDDGAGGLAAVAEFCDSIRDKPKRPEAAPMPNPILVELTRAALVESVHRGALAIARPNGEMVVSLGDVKRPVFPRSAVKAFQCLPLVESGAADAFGFGDREISIACASHSGTPAHAELAASMLARAHLTERALGCGAHEPMLESSARALAAAGLKPSQLHNNCSGKHAGMCACAVHHKEDPAGYWRPDHPVQQRIVKVLREFTGEALGDDVRGTDGCSAPNWAIPVASLARAFAAFITAEGPGKAHRAASERIARAVWAAPDMVAGPGRLDTIIMSKVPGKVFMKTGAEGVYCGAFPDLGLGFAVKIDDGTKRASEAVTRALLDRVLPATKGLGDSPILRNWVGTEVGEIRISGDLARTLDRLVA